MFRNTFVCASAAYVLFCAGVNLQSYALLYIGACISGFGAAVLWVQQGMYISSVAEIGGSIGYYTGHSPSLARGG